jgi:hypothetical protein
MPKMPQFTQQQMPEPEEKIEKPFLLKRGKPAHDPNCNSILSDCEFDARCRLCALLKKLIYLRRKYLSRKGFFMNPEAQSAKALADRLIAKYEIPQALLLDRFYTSRIKYDVRAGEPTRRSKKQEEIF